VACKIFGCCANGHGGFKDLETYVCPFPGGFEVNAAGCEGVNEFSSGCFEGVCADEDGAGDFVCFKKFDCLMSVYGEVGGRTSATLNISRNFRARYVL